MYKYILPIFALVLLGGGCSSTIIEDDCGTSPRSVDCAETQLDKALEWNPWESKQKSANRIAAAVYSDDNWQNRHQGLEVTGEVMFEEHGLLSLYADAASRMPVTHVKGFAAVYPHRHADRYDLYLLERYESEFHADVEAVFYQDIDGDKYKEIFVLISQMTGVGPEGAIPWYETLVYKLKDDVYIRLPDVEKQLHNLYPSSAVKQKLNQLY